MLLMIDEEESRAVVSQSATCVVGSGNRAINLPVDFEIEY